MSKAVFLEFEKAIADDLQNLKKSELSEKGFLQLRLLIALKNFVALHLFAAPRNRAAPSR